MRPGMTTLELQAAKKSAVEFCKSNGLRVEKLEKQLVHNINNKVIFAQPVCQKTLSGLKRDKETMPRPTLVVEKNVKGYVVKTTENTSAFLK